MSYIGAEPIVSATRTITEVTATAGQTVFTPNGGYTVGFLDVEVNGASLMSSDFTATNGTTVTLATACNVGDAVKLTALGKYNLASLDGSNLVDNSVTPAKLTQKLTLGTVVASTSGTSIDFTGIPSWVKRITVMFNGVSSNSTSLYLIQIGSGSVTTTGYFGVTTQVSNSVGTGTSSSTAGFPIYSNSATDVVSGSIVLATIGSNIWTCSGVVTILSSSLSLSAGNSPTLSGALDRVRITTVNGTDTFDAGSINILYEG